MEVITRAQMGEGKKERKKERKKEIKKEIKKEKKQIWTENASH